MNDRLSRRQKERFLSVSGTGHTGFACRRRPQHEYYAQQTLYAFMPCAGLRGMDYIDAVVQTFYEGSWPNALRSFVEDEKTSGVQHGSARITWL